MLYAACLLAVAAVVALISLIPNIGPLPRLGNRMVALIAALGLGGLVKPGRKRPSSRRTTASTYILGLEG